MDGRGGDSASLASKSSNEYFKETRASLLSVSACSIHHSCTFVLNFSVEVIHIFSTDWAFGVQINPNVCP